MPKHYALQDETREFDWPTLVFVRALKILPAWQLQATDTETDFAAAILLVPTVVLCSFICSSLSILLRPHS